MKHILYISILLLCFSVAGCKKESTKASANLIVGQWDFKQEIIKIGTETNIVIPDAKTYSYGKDGTVIVKSRSEVLSSFKYSVKNDTLVHILRVSSSTGYDPNTEFRESLKIKQLDEHNLVITYTQPAIPQVPNSDYFSEKTFTR